MRLRFLYNAGVAIESEETSGPRILCDPWFTPGAFLGSWFHSSPTSAALQDWVMTTPWDIVYVTHLHPDHFDTRVIARLARLNSKTRFVVPALKNNWLQSTMNRLVGRDRVLALSSPTTLRVGGIALSVVPLDACDPTRCLKQVPCHSNLDRHGIDSLGVIEADGVRVVLGNDALSPTTSEFFKSRVRHADVVMAAYGGASAYPQCYVDLSPADKVRAREAIVDTFCDSLVSFAQEVNAGSVIPYAGEYLLGGSLRHLNQDRASVSKEEALDRIRTRDSALSGLNAAPGMEICLKRDQSVAVIQPPLTSTPDEIEKHQKQLQDAKYPYEGREVLPEWPNWRSDVGLAASHIQKKTSTQAGIRMSSSFLISSGDVQLNLHFGSKFRWDLTSNTRDTEDNVTKMEVPPYLFKMLIRRNHARYQGFTTAHWNQAEVGSHISYSRAGVYEMLPHLLLNYLHM
jgi:UDP-MurNAc hydroxylase